MTDAEILQDGWRTWLGFLAMCLGMFMAILDIQIVTTSLPAIQQALKIATNEMSWIQTAYLTAEIVAIPLTGFLVAKFGMRWSFVASVSLFTLASAGCAESQGFASLIVWRIVQGFAGGTLIPTVFSAVFLLFPVRRQGLATMIAGVAAVLAPTIGPLAGGWLTQTYSWHWLFRVNIVPGIVAALGAALTLRGGIGDHRAGRAIDIVALAALAAGLTAFEIGMKQAPTMGWGSAEVVALLVGFGICAALFTAKTLRAGSPLIELRCFADRNFAIGCLLSFVFGIGLFGATYLLPFFLGLVREHNALQIGEVMLVTGVAQLVAAPVAVTLERRVDARLLTAFGFGLLAVGLLLSTRQTADTDFNAMLLPQILRGVAIMFCLLPPTRLALGQLPERLVADGSGVFNLMRNLGGAVGLALIDTTIFSRVTIHAAEIAARLRAGDVATAVGIGIPRDAFIEQIGTPPDDLTIEMIRPLVEKAALVQAINDAWLLIGVLTALSLLLIPFVRRFAPAAGESSRAPGPGMPQTADRTAATSALP